MPKPNAFFMFMKDRRKVVEEKKGPLAGGWAELANLLSAEWQALDENQRAMYKARAQEARGASALQDDESGASNDYVQGARAAVPPRNSDVSVMSLADRRRMAGERFELPYVPPRNKPMLDLREDNRDYLTGFFVTEFWKENPIVICSFNVYYEPELNGHPTKDIVPAEIGLVAFSLYDGVMDNYGRIIDPGKNAIPMGHGFDASNNAQRLGIPEPGTAPDFQHYPSLMGVLRGFLLKYRTRTRIQKEPDALFVFALDCDFELVTNCLEWLFENSGYERFNVKVLSLNMWTRLASCQNFPYLIQQCGRHGAADGLVCDITGVPTKAGQKRLSEFSSDRKWEQPLNKSFRYVDAYPLTKLGIFVDEPDVEAVLLREMNYVFDKELCCVYHNKCVDAIQYCALNKSNRYAYNILEYLTISNKIDAVLPGAHYPDTEEDDRREEEWRKRFEWLKTWHVTNIEMKLEGSEEAFAESAADAVQPSTLADAVQPSTLADAEQPSKLAESTADTVQVQPSKLAESDADAEPSVKERKVKMPRKLRNRDSFPTLTRSYSSDSSISSDDEDEGPPRGARGRGAPLPPVRGRRATRTIDGFKV